MSWHQHLGHQVVTAGQLQGRFSWRSRDADQQYFTQLVGVSYMSTFVFASA